MNRILEEALNLCQFIEPRLRAKGWHVALTGSTLYGKLKPEALPKQDIDLMFYPHRDDKIHDESLTELLEIIGVTNSEPCLGDEYDENEALVWKFRLKSGTLVNVWLVL